MAAPTLALTLTFLVGLAVSAKQADPHTTDTIAVDPETVTVRGLYQRHSAGYWNWRYRRRTRQLQMAHRRVHGLRRTLLASGTVSEAIGLAAVVYGNPSWLWRVAQCESRLDPGARNASEAAGLFQFIPSTFASTPFASFSIWSPYANALAAGWMHAVGRGGEWVCR